MVGWFGRWISLRKLERERLTSINTVLKSSDRDFVTFVASLLDYNPGTFPALDHIHLTAFAVNYCLPHTWLSPCLLLSEKRLTPTQALFHPFLAPICPFALLFGSPSSSRLSSTPPAAVSTSST